MRYLRGRAVHLLFYGVMLVTGAIAPAAAQTQPPGAGGVLDRIRPGATVRARLGPDRSLTGRYVPIGDGRLGISADVGTTDTLRLTQLSELSVRGRHTKAGAIVGGAAGAAFGLFVGFVVTAICDSADCHGTRPYLVAVPAFGVGGALLGAAVGAAIPKWRRVYP